LIKILIVLPGFIESMARELPANSQLGVDQSLSS